MHSRVIIVFEQSTEWKATRGSLMAEHARNLNWQQLLDEALHAPGNMGDIYNRFYSYSFLNQMYLRMQGVREPVATYERWQRLGRQVLRGAKAKEIIRPVIINTGPEDGEEQERQERVVGFKSVKCIFTVSDTIGKDLPPAELPGWDKGTALAQLGIREVPFASLDGNVQGYAHGVEIAINPVAVHPEKTYFHEIGHVVLGHTLPHAYEEYLTHRGVLEFQAEATAYLTMNELGKLDEEAAHHSRGYIQHWLYDEQPPEKAIQQVFTATDRILKAGRVAVAGATAESPKD